MPALKNRKHEAFAQAVAEGLSATRAYLRECAQDSCKVTSAAVEGCKLMAIPNVRLRVSELRTGMVQMLETKFGVRQETIARVLLDVIETPLSEIDETSPLCQEFTRSRRTIGRGDEAEEWETDKIKAMDKLAAIDKLNRMAGWYEPEKIEHSGGIAGMFAELTGAKKQT